jgi:N-acetylneuraminic acid mutarotase
MINRAGKAAFFFLVLSFGVAATWAGPGDREKPLTFEERVAYQKAIEEVYWRHTIWPKENPEPKPSLEQVMSDAVIAARVEDYLRKSDALERTWQRTITGEQLQAEMERMANGTRQPDVLLELFSALNNDPYVIAECLARPLIVDRFIHSSYAWDERFHGTLKGQAQSELRRTTTAETMRSLSGVYAENVWEKKGDRDREASAPILLDTAEWDDWTGRLHRMFGETANRMRQQGMPSVVSGLQEDEDRFYVIAILKSGPSKLKVATVEWRKQSFDDWWSEAKLQARAEIEAPVFGYTLPVMAPVSSCTNDSWTSTFVSTPTGRQDHTAVWTGSKMIVWGGIIGLGSYLNTGGLYDPSTDTWVSGGTSTTNAPAARRYHTAVWTGSKMIVWGGNNGSYLATGGVYDPSSNTWTATQTTGAAPTKRQDHTAVWTGTSMIIFGGYNGTSHLNTGGLYDPSGGGSWTATSTTNAPAARRYHTAVWTGSKMIIWGGGNAATAMSDGGLYDPSGSGSWTATSATNAPQKRRYHTAVWTGTKMIVWGGADGTISSPIYLNTGGVYDPSGSGSWTATSTTNVPAARNRQTAVWTGSKMIVWGGYNGAYLDTGGVYDPGVDPSLAWTATATTNAPSARRIHTAVWSGSAMIIWGGESGSAPLNTGGLYDPSFNTWLAGGTSTGPVERSYHTSIWTGSKMIVWGGLSGGFYLNTGGQYDPSTDTWTATSTTSAPAARQYQTAIWTGSEMIIWGGWNGSFLDTGGLYDPLADPSTAWSATSATNAPTARYVHTAVWTGGKMIVWGGYNGAYLDTGGVYDPAADPLLAWTSTSITNAAPARGYHTAVWTGSKMIVWGGSNGPSLYLDTGGLFDPLAAPSTAWSATSTTTFPPDPRFDHTAIWTGNVMVVWGGQGELDLGGSRERDVGGSYDPSSDSWSPGDGDTTYQPTARHGHTAIWTGSKMIVWGGYNSTSGAYLNTGGLYDPSGDGAWTAATSTTNAPVARYLHTAVWTGNQMIVWGGSNGPYLNTGGLYCAVGACTPPAAPVITGITDVNACAQNGIQVAFTGTAASFTLLKDGTPVDTNYISDKTYNPGDTASHTYVVRAVDGGCIADSTGLAGTDANNTPVITTITDVSACGQTGIQVSYTSTSGTNSLVRDGIVVAAGYVSGAIYNPGDMASYSYLVRSTTGSCDSNPQDFADADNSPTADTITSVTDVSACAQSGVKVNYASGTGATHDLYDSGLLAVTDYATGTTYDPLDTASHNYVVRAVNGSCTADSNQMAETDVDNSPATPTITPAPALVCADSAGNQADGPAGATSYSWIITNGAITSATNIQSITYTAGASGSVTLGLTVTNSSGCSAGNSIDVTINSTVPTISGAAANVCPATGVDLSTESGKTNYQWFQDGSPIGGANSANYTATASGSYTVSYTDNGCTGTSFAHAVTISTCSGCSTITLSPLELPNGKKNAPYGPVTITALGGAGGYTFSFDTLPPGMTLNSSAGELAGTPTSSGYFTFTVTATDSNNCTGSLQYTMLVCLYCDDFQDGDYTNPLPSWTFKSGTWNASTLALVGTVTKKGTAYSPTFGACTNCTFEADVKIQTAGARVSLMGWYGSKSSFVELRLMQDRGKILLKQKAGTLGTKKSLAMALLVNHSYHIKMVFSGGLIQAFVDGNPVPSMVPVATPTGNGAFVVKSPTGLSMLGSLDDVSIY